jgi:hypothetical protein
MSVGLGQRTRVEAHDRKRPLVGPHFALEKLMPEPPRPLQKLQLS